MWLLHMKNETIFFHYKLKHEKKKIQFRKCTFSSIKCSYRNFQSRFEISIKNVFFFDNGSYQQMFDRFANKALIVFLRTLFVCLQLFVFFMKTVCMDNLFIEPQSGRLKIANIRISREDHFQNHPIMVCNRFIVYVVRECLYGNKHRVFE